MSPKYESLDLQDVWTRGIPILFSKNSCSKTYLTEIYKSEKIIKSNLKMVNFVKIRFKNNFPLKFLKKKSSNKCEIAETSMCNKL